jgi:hypothetical protein
VIVTALGLSSLLVIGDALFGGPMSRGGLAHLLGALVLLAGGLVVFSAISTAFRRAWHRHLRRDTDRALSGLVEWSRRMLRGRRPGTLAPPLRLGERIALLAGLCLTVLDVVLTTLLLKDVFPRPPYRFEPLDALWPAGAQWSFYLTAASFKAGLELWFGVIDRMKLDGEGRRGSGWAATRWFLLGGASAFDAVLAASRGLLLAEQGLDGAAVTVSNIVFVGFGVAVPWVAAMTGSVLVPALEPLLARLGPRSLADAIVRVAALVVVWSLVLALGIPALVCIGALGLSSAIWFAVEDGVGLVMGQDAPPPDALVLFEPAWGEDPPRSGDGSPVRTQVAS